MKVARQDKQGNVTALYERLSRDDDVQGDSNSIINQKRLLERYAADKGFSNIRHYTDDGFSGANFERPAWKRMMEDIEAGTVSTVIAKDMSRIGRNYLEVGIYTEMYFPKKKVRFIAVNNNVDSNVQESSEFAPFLNIMNEYYLKECSRKIKASVQMKGRSGKHLCGIPIYGYKTDPIDKAHWVIDEEAAAVVRMIYQLCIEGNGPFQIAGILKERKVETPACYLAKRGLGNHKDKVNTAQPYDWSMGTVITILERPEYIGHTVSFRYSTESYRTKKRAKNDPKDWLITENTQEPIIDKDTWELVQKLRQTVRRTDTIGIANPFTGLCYCADCGAKMKNHRRRGKPLKSDPTKLGSGDDMYICKTNSNASNQHKKVCSAHIISTKALRSIVLEVIRAASSSALQDEEAFWAKVLREGQTSQRQAAKAVEKKLTQNRQRLEELEALIAGLFEANFNGKISDKRFQMLSQRYEAEQSQLEESIEAGERELEQLQTNTANVEKFLELARRYTDFTELTTPMLNQFVDRIVVHEAEKVDGERTQEVEVYLNYIGRFDLPERELTAEELAQLEQDKKRRAAARERCKRYRDKQREKRQKEKEAA